MVESDKLIEAAADRITAWAINMFEEDLRSGFQKINLFDDPWNQEISEVLKKQSKKQLAILSKVLPLGVFWQRPDMIDMRRDLLTVEKEAVEQFRADYDRLCRERFSQQVERVSKSRSRVALQHLKLALATGKKTVDEIGSRWGWESVSAGAGEWGLVLSGVRSTITVSLNLGSDFSLRYHISIFDTIHSRSVRFQDDYFKVLGLGGGAWQIGRSAHLPQKIVQISEFASWHVQEYRRVLKDIIDL